MNNSGRDSPRYIPNKFEENAANSFGEEVENVIVDGRWMKGDDKSSAELKKISAVHKKNDEFNICSTNKVTHFFTSIKHFNKHIPPRY